MAGGFISGKFAYQEKIVYLIQNKLPAIFVTVLALGVIILAFCSRFANGKSPDWCIKRKILAADNGPENVITFKKAPISGIQFTSDRTAGGEPYKNAVTGKIPPQCPPFFSKCTVRKISKTTFPSDKNILLKIALLYPIAIFFVCGFLSSSIFFMSKDRQILGLLWQNKGPAQNLEINVQGRVSSHVKNKNGTSYFSFATDKLLLKDLTTGNEQTINADEEVFVRIRTNDGHFLKRDDFISFNCSISNNKGFMSLTAYQDNVVKTDSGGKRQKLYNIRSRFYECIRNTFYYNLDYDAAALCEAIILGNTNNIPEKTVTDFRKSGIYHLIAISGLHITFFIFLSTVFINFILKASGVGGNNLRILRLVTFIFIILVLILYNFIAGQKASALRATVMSVFVLTANLMERQHSKKIILSICFILLLTLNPGFFYDWGFWLSFTSMAGILYINPVITDLLELIRKKVQKTGRYIFGSFPDSDDPDSSYKKSIRKSRGENYFVSSIVTTVSVSIFISPVLIFLFKELPVFSIPANLMASPVFYMLLAILLASSFLALLWPPLGGFILKPVGMIMDVLLKIARIYKVSDYNVISLSNLKAYQMIIFYFALAAVFIALSLLLDSKKAGGRKSNGDFKL